MSAANEQSFQAPPPPPLPEAGPTRQRPTKLRPVAIAIFVIGFVLLIGGATKFLPGGVFPGVVWAFSGIVMFALSFVPLPQVDAKEPPLSPAASILGVFYEPSRVFRSLRAYPRWAVAFIIIVVLSIVYTVAFVKRITPERIVNFTTDKIAESGFMPAEAVEQQRQIQLEQAKNPINQVMERVTTVGALFLKYCAVTGLILLGVLAFGGRINFWQGLSAVIYAALPWVVIQKILSLGLLYLKAPEDLHPILNQETLVQDNLGALISPAAHPVLFVLLSVFGVLWFYWAWLHAKALQLAGTKVSSSAAWGVTIIINVLMILFGVVMAFLFGSFMS